MNLFNIIKQKVSIETVISQYSSLKRAGSYLKGRCPFHDEKTASFTVSPDKNIFYCFGCHEGGDVISFIAKIENCTQFEAAKMLAEQNNIPITDELLQKSEHYEEKQNYIDVCTTVATWCNKQITKEVKTYLNKRGIEDETIHDFMIGLFPRGPKEIKQLLAFTQKNNIMAQDLIDAKILISSSHGLYSPFEDRIIFPITDHLGRVIAFGGRIFKEKDERAKYYNSHDHTFFDKGSSLYGLDKAKKEIQANDRVFVVEGYLDVIAMAQHGYTNTIATLGTACTQEHLKRISRYTQKLFIIYDADPAGHKAVIRLTELCWHENIDLYVITLPQGEDPASYLLEHKSLDSYIENHKDIFVFFIDTMANDFESKSTNQKIQSTKKILEIIFNMKDDLKRDILLQRASSKLNIPLETLKKEFNQQALPTKQVYQRPTTETSSQNITFDKNKITLLEKKLFYAILIYEGEIHEEDFNLLDKWLPKELKSVLDKLRSIKVPEKSVPIDDLFNKLTDIEKNIVSQLIMETEQESNIKPHFEQLLSQFYKKHWKVVAQYIKNEVNEAQKKEDTERIKKLLSYFDALRQKIVQRT